MYYSLKRRIFAFFSILAVVGTLVFTALPSPTASAREGERPFEQLFSEQTNGAITINGNVTATCNAADPECDALLNGSGMSNNDLVMQYLDADDDPATFNSSAASVRMEPGSKVLFAGLFWGGTTKPIAGTTNADISKLKSVKFKVPGGAYQEVTATTVDHLTKNLQHDYSAFANVTELVKVAGPGEYWVADVQHTAKNIDMYGAWSLVVAYENDDLPLRDLQIFNGYQVVGGDSTLDINFDGFITPAAGPVKAKFGTIVYEGDDGRAGDYMTLKEQGGPAVKLSDPVNPENNFFNSRVSEDGVIRTDRNPAYKNTPALDAKIVDASGVLSNGATAATATFSTKGDWFYPAVLTTQIDLYQPHVVGNKKITSLSGHDPARVGDTLLYEMAYTNTGNDPAEGFVLTDALPAGTDYVPGSIEVGYGINSSPVTDAAGDDQGEYDEVNHQVVARIGHGANATVGGELAGDQVATVQFKVKVNNDGAGTAISNTAKATFTGKTLGDPGETPTNTVTTDVPPEADVAITKTGPAKVNAGEELTYILNVTNAGPNAAADVVVSDTLPAGLTFVSATGTGATCSEAAGKITCNLGALDPNAEVAIAVTAKLDPNADVPPPLVNTASVTTTTFDPNLDNNTSTATTVKEQLADLRLEKTVVSTTPAPGEEVTYTLTVTNDGPSKARDAAITDTMPAGLQLVSMDTNCTGTTNISCTLGDLAVGESKVVTIKAKLDATWQQVDPIVNTAEVTSTTPDANPDNNTATATVTPKQPQADLAIEKTTIGEVKAGQSVNYRLAVTNNGPSQAWDVNVSDPLPAGLSGAVATTSHGTCDVTTSVNCALGDLPVGATALITVSADVAASVTGELTNTATVSAGGSEDPVPGNDSSTVTDPVVTSADLKITKTASATAVAGENYTYTLDVENLGYSDAQNVKITDTLPAEVTFVSASPECAEAAGTVTCDMGALAAKGTTSVTVTVKLPATIAADTPISNTAEVSSSTPDPDLTNNTATTELVTSESADVQVTKTGPADVTAGEDISWTITVTNAGPSDAHNVKLADTLPAALNAGATATTTAGTCAVVGAELSCDLATVAAKASATITVNGTVNSDFAGDTIANSATATSDSPDPTTSNNTGTSNTPVVQRADLGVVKSGPATAVAGEQITWTLTVNNAGPSTARNVVVTDNLPVQVTDVTATSAGATCQAVAGQILTCNVADLAANGSFDITVTGTVVSDTAPDTVLTNTANVGSDTPEPDGAEGNNSSQTTTKVTAKADVVIEKTADSATFVTGTNATYTLKVSNNGPSTAADVVVTDEIPAGLTPVSVQPAADCTIAGQTVTCTYAALASGAVQQPQITVAVGNDAPASITNTATVTTTTEDGDPTNNDSSVTTPVNEEADILVSKSAMAPNANAGSQIVYGIAVVNNGPSTAKAVTVTDEIPTGLTFVSADPRCTVAGTTITCNLGDMEAGTVQQPMVTLAVPADSELTTVTNTATGASETPDPNPDNNTGTSTVEITTAADLSITKSAAETARVGEDITWTLTVKNAGPSVARNTHVKDAIPAGLVIKSAQVTDGEACTITGQDIDCAIAQLPIGTQTITVVTQVASNYADETVTNTATVGSDTPDPDSTNNTGDALVKLVKEADLAITKTLDTDPLVPGGEVTYTVTVTNNGPADAQDATARDFLPGELLNPVVAGTGPNGDAVCAVKEATAMDLSVAACNFGPLAAGASATMTITATVDENFTGELVNTAQADSTTPDPDLTNNKDSATGTAVPAADLAIVKSLAPAAAKPGEQVTFTLDITNNGPSAAQNVVISDPLPAGLSDVTLGGDTSCELEPAADATTSGTVKCAVASMANGAKASVTITATLDADLTGMLDNTATVGSDTPDPNEENNSSTVSSPLNPVADLTIVKTQVGEVTAGEAVAWSLVVTNNGPATATNVVVSDTLPATVSDVTVEPADSDCAVVGAELTCNVAKLAPGESLTYTVKGTLAADATGNLVNTAKVTSDTEDPTPENNESTTDHPITVPPAPAADLAIVKTQVGEVKAGDVVTWNLQVTSKGPDTATNVVVSDTLPASISDIVVDPANDACTVVGQDLTCSVASLAAGETFNVTVKGTLAADATGNLVNTAKVTSDTEDPTPENNESTTDHPITVPPAPAADLAIVKTQVGEVKAGDVVTWNLQVTSKGPDTATNVVVSDTLPASISDIVVDPANDACTVVGQDLTCSVASLAAGETFNVTVKGTLAADATGNLVNTAKVTSDTEDPTPENNESTTDIPIGQPPAAEPVADLQIVKSQVGPAIPGQQVTWVLTASSLGPDTATDVVITDTLPDSISDIAIDPANPACAVAGQTVTCNIAEMAVADTFTVTITGTLAADATGMLDNSAAISATTTDPDMTNNDDAVSNPISPVPAPVADLRITKSQVGDAVAGDLVTWMLTIDNVGPDAATDVVITDELPAVISGGAVDPANPACAVAGQTLTCNIAEMAAGESFTVTVSGTLAADATGDLTNTAKVSFNGEDPTPENNIDSVTNPIVSAPPTEPTPDPTTPAPDPTTPTPAPTTPVPDPTTPAPNPGKPDLPITGSNAATPMLLTAGLMGIGMALLGSRRKQLR